MAILTIEAKSIWYSYPPDGSKCEGCGDLITSKIYQALIQIGEVIDLNIEDTDIKICKSCFDLLKVRNGNSN